MAGHLCFKKLPTIPQLVVTSNWLDVCELIRHDTGWCNQYRAWVGWCNEYMAWVLIG